MAGLVITCWLQQKYVRSYKIAVVISQKLVNEIWCDEVYQWTTHLYQIS